MQTIDEALAKLDQSEFRSCFRLLMAWIELDLKRYDEQEKARKAAKPAYLEHFIHPGDEVMFQ